MRCLEDQEARPVTAQPYSHNARLRIEWAVEIRLHDYDLVRETIGTKPLSMLLLPGSLVLAGSTGKGGLAR